MVNVFSSVCLPVDIAVDHQALLKQFEYLNHMNPHTFEVDDLDRLIKSVSVCRDDQGGGEGDTCWTGRELP